MSKKKLKTHNIRGNLKIWNRQLEVRFEPTYICSLIGDRHSGAKTLLLTFHFP